MNGCLMETQDLHLTKEIFHGLSWSRPAERKNFAATCHYNEINVVGDRGALWGKEDKKIGAWNIQAFFCTVLLPAW